MFCWRTRAAVLAGVGLGYLGLGAGDSYGFVFVFADEANPDRVTHPLGYSGSGGVLNITVGVDPTSVNATSMLVSTQNTVITFNSLVATTGNFDFSTIGGGEVDFESVLLHEMGHSLGLGHINLASESGLSEPDRNYTKSGDGPNNTFDLGIGADGVRGSADDVRGDDVNLNWFRMTDNDPFDITLPGTIDSTTYSRDVINDLPVGDNFSANADRDVGALLGYANSEAVMQQGSFFGEVQRSLGADDVAGMRYAMSGLDEIQGTADDYTVNLIFAGLDDTADIVIDFDNTQTGFAVSQASGINFASDHFAITSTAIYFNDSYNWHFNAELIPEPGRAILGLVGLVGVVLRRRRR